MSNLNLYVLGEDGSFIALAPEFVADGSTHGRWRRVKGLDGEWYDHAGEDAQGNWTYRHTDHDMRNPGRLVG